MLLVVRCHNEVEDFVAKFLWDFVEEWAVPLQVDGVCKNWSHGCAHSPTLEREYEWTMICVGL